MGVESGIVTPTDILNGVHPENFNFTPVLRNRDPLLNYVMQLNRDVWSQNRPNEAPVIVLNGMNGLLAFLSTDETMALIGRNGRETVFDLMRRHNIASLAGDLDVLVSEAGFNDAYMALVRLGFMPSHPTNNPLEIPDTYSRGDRVASAVFNAFKRKRGGIETVVDMCAGIGYLHERDGRHVCRIGTDCHRPVGLILIEFDGGLRIPVVAPEGVKEKNIIRAEGAKLSGLQGRSVDGGLVDMRMLSSLVSRLEHRAIVIQFLSQVFMGILPRDITCDDFAHSN